MTTQESFKRRIRARMATTGERYAAARRQLLAAAEPTGAAKGRTWVAAPEVGDDAVRRGTGRGWDDWCDAIEGCPVAEDDHPAIARHLEQEFGVGPWWAQTVTIGFERITGRRLPYQRPDGTFTASKSQTVSVHAETLRQALLSADDRALLFPGEVTDLRSKSTAKTLRISLGPGVAAIGITAVDDARTKVTVQHEKLPTYDDVEAWRFYWADWLDALEGSPST